MPHNVKPNEILIRLQGNFELESQTLDSWEQLRLIVAKKVAELMELNPGDFFNLLYIMDVSEEKINHAIHNADAPYFAIADIIIERENQKVITRKQYADYFDNSESEAEEW